MCGRGGGGEEGGGGGGGRERGIGWVEFVFLACCLGKEGRKEGRLET